MNLLDDFETQIAPYKKSLLKYCLLITGTSWDAEDLYQETLIKTYRSIDKFTTHASPQAYLFRIASNAWIDNRRKQKIKYTPLDDVILADVSTHTRGIELRDAIERLAYCLPPRQAVVFLLTEVFDYSAKDTASMLDMTQGGVKAALHRARRTLAAKSKDVWDEKRESSPKELIDEFQRAFIRDNPLLICKAYHSLQKKGIEVKRQKEGARVYFVFYDFEGNVLSILQPR